MLYSVSQKKKKKTCCILYNSYSYSYAIANFPLQFNKGALSVDIGFFKKKINIVFLFQYGLSIVF